MAFQPQTETPVVNSEQRAQARQDAGLKGEHRVHIGDLPDDSAPGKKLRHLRGWSGFHEASARSVFARLAEKRAREGQLGQERNDVIDKGHTYTSAGVELIAEVLSRGKVTRNGSETQEEAIQRAAQDEFDHLRGLMFDDVPRQDQLKDTWRGRRLQDKLGRQNRDTYRMIRGMLSIQQSEDQLDITVTNVTTGEKDTYLSSQRIEAVRQWLLKNAQNLEGLPVSLVQAIRAEQGNRSQDQGTRPSLENTMGRTFAAMSKLPLEAGMAAALAGGRQLESFTTPLLQSLTSALQGAPESIVATRALIRRIQQVAGPVEAVIGMDLIGKIEQHVNIPDLISTFMKATDAVEAQYYVDHPNELIARMEEGAQGWHTENKIRAVALAKARHERALFLLRSPFRIAWEYTGAPLFQTKGHQQRMAARAYRTETTQLTKQKIRESGSSVRAGRSVLETTEEDRQTQDLLSRVPGLGSTLSALDALAGKVDEIIAPPAPPNADQQSALDQQRALFAQKLGPIVDRYLSANNLQKQQIRDAIQPLLQENPEMQSVFNDLVNLNSTQTTPGNTP